MKRRIHGKFLIVSAAAIIITAFFGMLLFYNILKGQIFDDMKADSKIVSLLLEDVMEEKEAESLKEQGLRITVAQKDGTVIYDSVENIRQREGKSLDELFREIFRMSVPYGAMGQMGGMWPC